MSLKNILKNIGGKLVTEPSFSDSSGKSGKFDSAKLPWSGFDDDAFFKPKTLDPERANNLYPYRLIVIDVKKGNSPVSKNGTGTARNEEVTKYEHNSGGVQYAINGVVSNWEFTLPITPQQLSITDQFAINTSATMRGIVEEHNGVKFKIIQASGTTGIWPTRNNFDDPNTGQGTSLFGGTVEALGGVARAVDALNQATGKSDVKKPDTLNFKKDNDGQNTGYFQAQLLQQFLEQYAMAKKDPKNKHWRLVFDCPKINESFVVTPMQFTTTKSQRSPGETLFNMQFKAWKRVQISRGSGDSKLAIQELNPNFFQTLTSSLDAARGLMSASLNVIKAVRADFRKPFDALRKVTLLMKDFAGIGLSLADLPNQINKDITSATRKRASDLALALGGSVGSKTRSLIKDIKKESDNDEGVSSSDVEQGENGKGARDQKRISPVNNLFNEPESNYEFFSTISLDELELTPQQKSAIEDEIELNSLISIEEIKGFIKETQDLILDLSNNFGAGDEFFSKVFGRPVPKKRAIPMTIEEFELIKSLEEAVLNMNMLVATRDFDDVRTESPLEYIGGLAEESGIEFNSSSTSKYLAPVPFGLTIEEISARYLGDPDRYNEIVTINNLRSPYIDEEGFFYELLSNGDGRQFNINGKEGLFIGQTIQISSNTVPLFARKITEIEKITDTNYLITLDGLSDLEKLKTDDKAKIKGFLPGTVNSQNQIYIPSDQPVEDQSRTFDIPFLQGDTLTGISKIDWLLDDEGDIVINSFGEANLANGITNIVQALKMKISTEKGQILSEPSFGVGVNPGVNVSEIQIENLLKDMKEMVIADTRFSGVENIEVNILPPNLSIKINAILANGNGIFPINFTV